MQYQVIESKLNHMSLEELELCDPDPFKVIVNKLLNISAKPTQSQINALNALSNKLACIDDKKPVYRRKGKYIFWSESKKAWVAMRNINGKNVYIKQNQNREIVQQAYNFYCIENHIQL